MPLEHSSSPAALHRNMHTLFGDIGKSPHVQSRKQAIAIALETQRRAGRAAGGFVPGFDAGGTVDPVTAVINALNAGATSGGVAPPVGTSAASTPAAAMTPKPAMPAVAPAPVGVAPPAVTTTMPAAAPGTPSASPALAPSPTTTVAPTTTTPAVGVAPAPTQGSGVLYAPTPTKLMNTPLMRHGGALDRAGGGFNMAKGPNLNPPWFERNEARNLHVGPVMSNVPGRTDNHQIRVPGGSYVLPASHLSSMGRGNSMAGMNMASKMFSGGPYGTPAMKLGHGSLPKPPKPFTYKYAAGGGYSEGGARGEHSPVDVNVSGGEFIIPPWAIIQRYGNLKAGHKILDQWVMNTRKDEIKTQRKLPPPATK